MSCASRVLGKQDVARTDDEVFAGARLEIERAAQGDDELADRRIVPGKCAARLRLLEGNAGGAGLAAQQIASRTASEIDRALLEPGVAVSACPYSDAPYHCPRPWVS